MPRGCLGVFRGAARRGKRAKSPRNLRKLLSGPRDNLYIDQVGMTHDHLSRGATYGRRRLKLRPRQWICSCVLPSILFPQALPINVLNYHGLCYHGLCYHGLCYHGLCRPHPGPYVSRVVLNSNMAETLDSALSFLAARGPSAPALKSSEPEVEYVFVGLEPGSTAQLSSEIILKVRGCPPTHARKLALAHDDHHHHHHYHRRRRRHRQ